VLFRSSVQANRALEDGTRRCDKLREQINEVAIELAELSKKISEQSGVQEKARAVTELESAVAKDQSAVQAVEAAAETAREAEQSGRAPVTQAQAKLSEIETEAKTLARIFNSGESDLFPAVLESIRAQQGYEKALGAALGEDLDAPLDPSAPVFWSGSDATGDPDLPSGTDALSNFVSAPAELARRLAQIGVVDKETGDRLHKELATGQRLVSLAGDLWRWDGYRASAEAPTPAAIRLEQKNRLADLDKTAVDALKSLRDLEAKFEDLGNTAKQTRENERAGRDALREKQNALGEARKDLSTAEREVSDLSNRRSALEEAKIRLAASFSEAEAVVLEAQTVKATLPDLSDLESKVQATQNSANQHRSALAEIRAEFDSLARENTMRADRLGAIERERKGWNDRAVNADRQIQTLRQRLAETISQKQETDDAPNEIEKKRRELLSKIDAAETERKKAADLLAGSENDLRDADKAATIALNALSDAKQTSARAEERLESSRERRGEMEARIREELECEPQFALQQTGVEDDDKLNPVDQIERRLERLRAERDRLGAVNLRAEEEQNEITEQRDTLVKERDDLIEAIRQLRLGIQSLNKEGRERLLTAFDEVNEQFQKLFTNLFGGGTAELQLIESDDPLEAGLEILARPPGKKPQTLTLLSGGEQALTAMALIFAVFLTNPAPICVLDEVDAPLDDHNVERFCNLMDQMSENTNTRFVIITHNPITMARMNRLFGVTMAERGVSQLVSVDLETAETYLEAG